MKYMNMKRGFGLVECVIAIAIFTIMSLIVAMLLGQSIAMHNRNFAETRSVREQRRAMMGQAGTSLVGRADAGVTDGELVLFFRDAGTGFRVRYHFQALISDDIDGGLQLTKYVNPNAREGERKIRPLTAIGDVENTLNRGRADIAFCVVESGKFGNASMTSTWGTRHIGTNELRTYRVDADTFPSHNGERRDSAALDFWIDGVEFTFRDDENNNIDITNNGFAAAPAPGTMVYAHLMTLKFHQLAGFCPCAGTGFFNGLKDNVQGGCCNTAQPARLDEYFTIHVPRERIYTKIDASGAQVQIITKTLGIAISGMNRNQVQIVPNEHFPGEYMDVRLLRKKDELYFPEFNIAFITDNPIYCTTAACTTDCHMGIPGTCDAAHLCGQPTRPSLARWLRMLT